MTTLLCCLLSCDRSEIQIDEPTPDSGSISVVSGHKMKDIVVTAGLEQHVDPSQTKTTLYLRNDVVWNEGDRFSVMGLTSGDGPDVTCEYSTNYGTYTSGTTTYALSNCHDGSTSTYFWSNDAQSEGKFVLMTFSSPVRLTSFQAYSSNNTDYPHSTNDLQVSSDGSEWTTVGAFSNSQTSTFSGLSLDCQYVRIYASRSGTSNWLVLNEITMEYTALAEDVVLNSVFTIDKDSDMEVSGSFTGSIPENVDQLYAVYPYSENNSFDGSSLSFNLPQIQEFEDESFACGANPSVGVLEGDGSEYSVAFQNVCGVLKINLKGEETVTSIDVIDPDSSHSLWGTASVSVSDIGTDNGYATVYGGTNVLTVVCPEPIELNPDLATPFYFIVPVGSFSQGFKLVVNTLDGSVSKTATVANTIRRSVIKYLPDVSTTGMTTIDSDFAIEDFDIENAAAADYLSHSTVTLSSTGDSNYGQSFFDQSRSYRPDQPNSKTITFSNASASNVAVLLATDPYFSDKILNVSTTESSYTFRNFVPGTTYYYKVMKGYDVLTSGAIAATGQLRMIAVDKGFNIRDLGGWTGIGGNTVRYEQLYRGASLGGTDMNGTTSDITAGDKAELYRIGMRAQLDLRAATNSGKYSGEYSYHSYSRGETTLTDADFNNTMTDYGAYNQDASVVCDVAWIIYELKKGKPVYFNCRQGADRTGTLAFIIEGLLGCYGSDTGHQMAMDYELTGFSQANLVDNKSVDTSYRGATEAYGNSSKLFYALLNLSVSDMEFNSLQEKCYYYLNRYWTNRTESGSSTNTVTLCIDKSDLDWFINFMLGVTDIEGNLAEGHSAKISGPEWAYAGENLKSVAEAKANVVEYVD